MCCVLLFVMSFFLSYFSLFCFALSFLIKHTYYIFYLNKILYSKILHFYYFIIIYLLLLCLCFINQTKYKKYDIIFYY